MTKAELIRKVAKRAGIPDQEAKFFFELFLKKVSLKLHPGETIKMNSLGYFQLKTGRIKNTGTPEGKDIHSEFIVFYSLDSYISDENLVFNVPELEEENYNYIDSFFSLSFGKPVIPLKHSNNSEYFIPPTGSELRRLAEIKSEKLLQEIEPVDKNFKGSENLIIKQGEDETSQVELDLDKPEEKINPGNILSWNFGSALDKEIEKESILDTGSEDNKDVIWDFGEHVKDTAEEKDKSEEKSVSPMDEYQEVKAIVSGLNVNINTSWDSGGEDLLKESITEELNKNKSVFSNEEIKEPIREEPGNQPIFSEEKIKTPVTEEINKDISPLSDEAKDDVPGQEELPQEKEEEAFIYNTHEIKNNVEPAPLVEEVNQYHEEDIYEERVPNVRKKKGLGLFLIISIAVIISAAVLFYFYILGPQLDGNKVVTPERTVPSAAIIERSYDIPVTYPYDSSANLSDFHEPYNIHNTESSIVPETKVEGTGKSGTEKEQNTNTPVISENDQNKSVSGTSEKVKEFIYKQGDKYLVQVSSWQGKRLAEKHAASFQEKGMVTEIQKVYLDGEPWYRVRVGYFNSLSEAENYSHNNR